MIIVIARVEIDPGAIAALEPAVAAIIAATVVESGCLFYSIAIEDRARGSCTITERWTDEAALRAHLQTPHVAAFNAAMAGKVRGMDARLFDGVNERPLVL